jgi:AcrR family transcriptional regulator
VRTRNSAATRHRLLDAAAAEFAERGLAGARVDRIAATAEANKQLIYAHFGSKEGLWLTVLERAYEAKRDEERALDVAALTPVEGIAELVRFNLRYAASHPEFVGLLNQENVHRAAHLRRSERVRALYSPLLDLVRDLLGRGEREGMFRRGVDPLQLYVSIVALGHFYVANLHTLSTVFGAGLEGEAALRAREAHCIAMVLGYLRP